VEGLKDCYTLTGPYQVQVTVDPPEAGQIQLNSLTLKTFPFTGKYYGNMKTKFTALETNQLFEFSHWEVANSTINPSDTSKSMYISLASNDIITAIFEPRVFADSIVINEINYNSAPSFNPGDWVEFYNPQSYPLDISGWVFKDEDDQHAFVFPAGTVMEAEGYLVIADDMDAFHNLFPNVTNYVGPMGFGLSGNGELIRVYNDEGTLVDTVHYDDQLPWPLTPDGEGATLALISPWLDNALPQSWKGSIDPAHGTPGEENGLDTELPETAPDQVIVSIQPNPFRTTAILKIETDQAINGYTFGIYTLTGKKVVQYRHIGMNQLVINRDGLPAGCYLFRLTDRSGRQFGSGKLMIAD
jgi:hypothetical protein